MKLKNFFKNLIIILVLFILFIVFVFTIVFTLFSLYNFLFEKSLTSTSSINQLLEINIVNLFLNTFMSGILLLSFFMLSNSFLALILKIFNRKLTKEFYVFEVKAYFILVAFMTMLFNFNSEQFNIIATIFSLWAISSSSKFTKKIIEKIVEIITANN